MLVVLIVLRCFQALHFRDVRWILKLVSDILFGLTVLAYITFLALLKMKTPVLLSETINGSPTRARRVRTPADSR